MRESAPAENMAWDEALLERVADLGRPVFRPYGWSQAAATFGYFQRYADVETWTALRPLVRRPTGGGLVCHDEDWTYALVFPPGHPWYALSARESYERVHDWLRAAFQRLGLETRLAPCCEREAPGRCFAGAEQFDLLREGRKLAGAAQRRNREGLLIQGSVQPRPAGLEREAWLAAMLATAPAAGKVEWEELPPDAALRVRVGELRDKYESMLHNRRR